jgi:hypothetical protein
MVFLPTNSSEWIYVLTLELTLGQRPSISSSLVVLGYTSSHFIGRLIDTSIPPWSSLMGIYRALVRDRHLTCHNQAWSRPKEIAATSASEATGCWQRYAAIDSEWCEGISKIQ